MSIDIHYILVYYITINREQTTRTQSRGNGVKMRKFVLVYQLKINYEITSKVVEARNVSEAWERLEEIETRRIIASINAWEV